MNDIHSLTPEELSAELGLSPPFRGVQLFEGIHRDLAVSYDRITALPAPLRTRLASSHPLEPYIIERDLMAADGTRKLLVRFPDGLGVETVLLLDENGRATACVSTQIGCAMGCRFCRTAGMGLKRNLGAGEIVIQALILARLNGGLDTIVFMGMGEPLSNPDALQKSVEILSHPRGWGWSLKRMTISTSGLVPGILRLAEEGPRTRLAVSLNAADDEKRRSLMPAAGRYPLSALKEALLLYQRKTRKRVTLEWVLLRGINSGPEDAKALARFVKGLSVVVNVIPWNRVPGLPFEEPDREEVDDFVRIIGEAGMTVTRRYRRGRGINGACGQLAT